MSMLVDVREPVSWLPKNWLSRTIDLHQHRLAAGPGHGSHVGRYDHQAQGQHSSIEHGEHREGVTVSSGSPRA